MLTLVPTPIGNIADITFRALSALKEADILLCEDTRVTKKLLNLLKERYNLDITKPQKFISLHSHNEDDFINSIDKSFFDKNVVYVSDAGLPSISDPGAKLVEFCQKNNIDYDVLPGSNAALTAYVASGFIDKEFLFIGFLPHKGKERETELEKALYSGYITILYEAPHRLQKLLDDIDKKESFCEIFLAKELTKKFQTYYKGTPKELLKKLNGNFKGEWVVVINSKQKQNSSVITYEDIISLDIHKKQKAKLLSKITNKPIKEIYNQLH